MSSPGRSRDNRERSECEREEDRMTKPTKSLQLLNDGCACAWGGLDRKNDCESGWRTLRCLHAGEPEGKAI